MVNEFVVGIGEPFVRLTPVPGFGGVHFLAMIDRFAGRYRIWMSLERRLSADEVRGAFGTRGFACPPIIASPSAPDFAAFRYLPSDWQDWRSQAK